MECFKNNDESATLLYSMNVYRLAEVISKQPALLYSAMVVCRRAKVFQTAFYVILQPDEQMYYGGISHPF